MKYSPHEYQTYATNFLLMHPASAIFLDCGLGKSVITLTALFDLGFFYGDSYPGFFHVDG